MNKFEKLVDLISAGSYKKVKKKSSNYNNREIDVTDFNKKQEPFRTNEVQATDPTLH